MKNGSNCPRRCSKSNGRCLLLVFNVLFIVVGQIRVILGFFGVFGAFSQCLRPKSEVAPRRLFWAPRSPEAARADFQMSISSSLLIRITHMIRRWKALLMIFNLICNMLYKNFRNLRVILSQSEAFFFLNSNCSEFSCFGFICSHFSQLTYISNKSPIKTKAQSILT